MYAGQLAKMNYRFLDFGQMAKMESIWALGPQMPKSLCTLYALSICGFFARLFPL
jgi:hypothetical protein